MRFIFGILAALTGVYSLLIFLRIIFSWVKGLVPRKPMDIIGKVTDPYLDWWKGKLKLQIASMDFSVLAAVMFLYLIQNIFRMLSSAQIISIGIILAMILVSLWSVISFIGIFFIVVIILRIIAYLANRNTQSSFWMAIDSISKPVIYQFNRIIFGKKIVHYLISMIVPVIIIAAALLAGRILINTLAVILERLPV